MAYTIPTSADTPEQAILAVASAVKGEQVTGGDGSVNTALDILADALAGENVEVPMTQQGAILALAQYVGGGGGGDTTDFWMWNSSEDAGAVTQYVGVSRAVGIDGESFITEPCEVEQVTTTYEGQTIYGVHVTGVPVGSVLVVNPPQSFTLIEYSLLYALESFPPVGVGNFGEAPLPMDGYVVSGYYTLESTI